MQTHHSEEATPQTTPVLTAPEPTTGERLEAGLAADQQWRREREEALRKRLVTAHRLRELGRDLCILAGLLEIALVVFALSGANSTYLLPGIRGLLGSVVLLLWVSGWLVLAGRGVRWRTFARGRAEAVEITARTEPTGEEQRAAHTNLRAAVLQEKVQSAYADESYASRHCLLAGWTPVPLAVIYWLIYYEPWAISTTWLIVLLVLLLVCLVPLVILPFASLAALLIGYQRKCLLKTAARERLPVVDPARLSVEMNPRPQPPLRASSRSGWWSPGVLNDGPALPEEPTADPAWKLRQATLALTAAYTDSATGTLDYERAARSPEFDALLEAAQELRGFDPRSLEDAAEKLAFWINVYNALTIHAIVTFRPLGTVWFVPGFFQRAAYDVGGCRFSLHAIEHGILRANRPAPYTWWRPFRASDPRRRLALAEAEFDPRVHFALNSGSRACPPIASYTPDRIDMQLDAATRSYLGTETGVEGDRIVTSPLLKWYRRDFDPDPRDFLARHLPPELAEKVRSGRITFRKYDWSLNAGRES